MADLGVPRSLSSFVGRRAALADLGRVLALSRLVTAVGPRGVGKTRLVAELARAVEKTYATVWWCADEGEIAEAVSRLAQYPREDEVLVVVDGADGEVAPRVREGVEQLLHARDSVRVLVTARRRLAMAGEQVIEVMPLAGPEGSTAGVADDAALFVDRVREVCADFDASAAAGTIADICELLDGIPATIEAAAAGYRAMSLETILAALRDGRVASPLEAVLGDHLAAVATDLAAATATRRRAWALAVGYQGYVTTSCFEPAEDDRAADPVTAFIDLVDDHGLLREAASGPGFSAFKVPTPYRRMLGVVDVLDEDDVGSAARMKEAHLRGLLEALAAGWFGPDHSSLLTHVNLHRADIEIMLAEMAASPAKAAELIELVTSLRYFWRVGEGELWRHAIAVLLEALPQVPETESAYVRGLSFLSYLRLFEADYESAREASDRSLELASERGDETSMRYALITRALLDLQDPQEIVSAERLVRSSVEASSGQLGELGEQYNLLATILYVRGELRAAEEVCRVSLHDSETMGDTWGAAYTSLALARVLRARGESEACCDLVREAFVVFDRVNDASGMRRALRLLAGVVMDLGDLERSAVLVGATRQFPAVSSPFGFVDAENLEQALSTRIGWQTLGFRMAAGAELTRTQLRSIVRGGELPRDSSLSVLTSREEEIAELVAAGHSNGQIAQQLVVSRRTVEGHVQRILAKLDFHSRSQIAVWYTEQRRIARGSLIAINSGDSARPTRRALVSH